MLTYVSAGYGVGVISRSLTAIKLPNVVFRELGGDNVPQASIACIHRRNESARPPRPSFNRCAVTRRKLTSQLARKHSEDALPIAVGRALVVNVAIGQRIAVDRAAVHPVAIAHIWAALKRLRQRFDRRRRGEIVMLGKAAIDFAAIAVGQAVQRGRRIAHRAGCHAGSRSP